MTMDNKSDQGVASAGAREADFTHAVEPFLLFERWLAEASKSEPNDPNAMALATTGLDGVPNVRMVLLKGLDASGHPGRGFVFYTNLGSAKGQELSAKPQAALLFHWKSLGRQVRVRGTVALVTDEEANAYFATRDRLSRIGAWASKQSEPLESRFALEKAVAVFTAKLGISEVHRPDYWSGYRLTPTEIEFWHSRPHRLHDRILFRRTENSEHWTTVRLYP